MKLLKLVLNGLPHFNGELAIDFMAMQRVSSDNRDTLHNVFSNMYTNNAIAFIGINASGKTTILKSLSFAISLLNNEPLNKIKSRDILEDMQENASVIIEFYFYCDHLVYKLETVINKLEDEIDGSTKYIIENEKLWVKSISKVKTKKSLFVFEQRDLDMERNQKETYLMDDVSIIIALNKIKKKSFFLRDMSGLTNFNMLNVLGKYPKELLAFLDPSIEYLTCKVDGKDIDIRLKFKEKEEIVINNPLSLERYLSSGTIKGMSIFMNAVFVFKEGGYLIVDELENHFNREIVSTLIRFFMDHNVNNSGATIIFSTHYSELLDEFDRNDSIYIVRNRDGITAENLSNILYRNDIKKSEAYQSDFLEGTVPAYEAYIELKKALVHGD